MIMTVPILMLMVTSRHILVLHIVHTAHGALPWLIAAAALAVHGADVGGGVFWALLVRIGFRFTVYFGLISGCLILTAVCITATGYNE